MKKTSKILAVVLVAVLAMAALAVLTACASDDGTYTGEIHIDGLRTGTNYQAKVEVTVKGDKITAVKLLDLDEGYVWSSRNNAYGDKEQAQAWVDEAIVDQDVDTVLGWKVDITQTSTAAAVDAPHWGIPQVDDEGNPVLNDDGTPKTSKATETGARIIAAVQDALCQMKSVKKVTGECSYANPHGSGTYGVKVDVYVRNKTIIAVKLYTDAETGWIRTSSNWGTGEGQMQYNETDLGYDATEKAYNGYLVKEIVGQSVDTVLGWTAVATAEEQSVTTGAKLAGATQSSARIICAIQNALGNL